MPDERETVRIDVEHTEATSQHRPQLSRRRKQRSGTLSLRTGQDEQKRSHRRVLNDDGLPPAGLRFRQKDRDTAANRVYLPPRVMDICRCDARNLTDTQSAVVRDHHSNANRDFSGQTSQRSTGPDQVPRERSCRLRGLQLSPPAQAAARKR